jgi:hypothetical protein
VPNLAAAVEPSKRPHFSGVSKNGFKKYSTTGIETTGIMNRAMPVVAFYNQEVGLARKILSASLSSSGTACAMFQQQAANVLGHEAVCAWPLRCR